MSLDADPDEGQDSHPLRRLAVPIYGPAGLFFAATGAVLPILPLYATRLGASIATAALVVTLSGIGSLAGSIPGSVLTARWGERRLIIVTSFLATGSLIAAWLSPTVALLAAAMAVFGACASIFTMARQNYLTEQVPFAMRARALSTLGGVYRIGMFVGPFLGAGAIALWGLRSVFLVAVLLVLAAGAVSLTMPEDGDPASPSGARRSAGVTIRSILIAHRSSFVTIGTVIALIAAVRACRQVATPLWAEHLGLPPETASLIYGIASGVDTAVFYPAGRFMDTRGRRIAGVASLVVMGIGFVVMPFAGDAQGLLIASTIVGIGNGIGSGLIMTMSADLSPDVGRPQFLGVNRLLADAGTAAGPAFVSGLTAAATLAIGLWAAAALSVGTGLLLAVLIPHAYRRVGVSFRGTRAATTRPELPKGERRR